MEKPDSLKTIRNDQGKETGLSENSKVMGRNGKSWKEDRNMGKVPGRPNSQAISHKSGVCPPDKISAEFPSHPCHLVLL